MKLFIIVLCLLSERFLVHAISYNRFYWFSSYFDAVLQRLPKGGAGQNPVLVLVAVLIPLLFISGMVLYIFSSFLFGFISLIFNLAIFYYCLGPNNPFYPIRAGEEENNNELAAGNYFAKVNGQLFAVIFWYIVTGPLGLLCYRLITLCRTKEPTAQLATWLTDLLDWIPARITVLLYLLVGNFQHGLHYFAQMFFSSAKNNESFLSKGGLLAAHNTEDESVTMPYAESLVEHATIVFLVFLAFFTLVALL